ncbi:hypothetical protein EDD21DRAFT_446118 [Dissophora ornata]|nr:hypothetical protein EDD21DRAFT_446118 [Dissophora ornata]
MENQWIFEPESQEEAHQYESNGTVNGGGPSEFPALLPYNSSMPILSSIVPINSITEQPLQIVQHQPIGITELEGILFSPRVSPVLPPGTYPLETQSNVSRTQTAIVAAASVVQESTVSGDTRSNFGLATQDREGKRQRLSNSIQESNSDETDSQANSQRLVKRQRKALQLQEKLEIIDYWEQNSPISFQKMETHHDVPRTTIYGIIKDRQRLQTLARSQPRAHLTLGTSRMVESRFRVLEELLVAWIMDLRSQCIPVYDKKITTQAFEIHRMLSGLLAEPLPACSFSSGWLKNFKKRRQIG